MAGTLDQSQTDYSGGAYPIAYNTSYWRFGNGWKPGVTGVLEEVHVRLSKTNTPANNIWVAVYTDNGSGYASTTQVGGNSGSIVGTSVAVDPSTTEVTFSWSSNKPSLTSGTRYHYVLETDLGSPSSSNWNSYWVSTSGGTNQLKARVCNTSNVWSEAGNYYFMYKTYMTASSGIKLRDLGLLGIG